MLRRVESRCDYSCGGGHLGHPQGKNTASPLLVSIHPVRYLMAVLLSVVLCTVAIVTADASELTVGGGAVVANTEGDGLRLRQTPGLSGNPLGLLPEGTRVQVLDGPRLADGEQWYQVRFDDRMGWAAGRYLRGLGDPAVLTPLTATAARPANTLRMQVVGYHVPWVNTPRTSTGTVPRWGTVAVDPQVIPLGTRLLIEGFEGTVFVAEDTGAAVRGLVVDVWFDDLDSARRFGSQTRTVTILGR